MATAILTTPRHQGVRHLAGIAGLVAAGALGGAVVTAAFVDSGDATTTSGSRVLPAPASAPASPDAIERRLADPVVVEPSRSLPASADAAERWLLDSQVEATPLTTSGPR